MPNSFVENINKVAALIPAEVVDLGIVIDNIDNINSLAPVITDLQSIVDNVVPNIAEILLADDNAATATTQAGIATAQAVIATTKAGEASTSASQALGYRDEAEAFSESKAFVVDTVEDLLTIPSSYVTAIVRDLDRGGTFIYDATKVGDSNDGTNFSGWIRQYSGAVNVKWFGAKGDGITDDTGAITNAQIANKNVFVPYGTYLVSGLRIYNKVNLIGEGYENTVFKQGSTSQPAINCLSDATVGQLSGLELKNFKVVGATGATVSAVLVAAYGAYAIWRSVFDFIASTTYTALEIQGNDGANIFWCEFKVTSENTSYISVIANGGVYNKFSLFLTQCYNKAYQGQQSHAIYNHLITEGPIYTTDQNSVFNIPTIENLPQFVGTSAYAFSDSGFNNTWNTPTAIFNSVSDAKITTAVFKTFSYTTIQSPRFLTNIANPFAENINRWTLIGAGQSGCANKIEVIYDDSGNTKEMRKITMVGVDSTFTSRVIEQNNLQTQVDTRAAGASINYNIKSSTDAMIFNHAGTATLINISLGYGAWIVPDGKTISVYTVNAITTISWSGGTSDKTLFPLTMTSGQKIKMVYNLSLNKWFPV